MKTRIRNIFLLLVLSLSLNGSTSNLSCPDKNGEYKLTTPQASDEGKLKQVVDVTLEQPPNVPGVDSLTNKSKTDTKDFDTTASQEEIEICSHNSAKSYSKTTMFDLLIKWISLLLELS